MIADLLTAYGVWFCTGTIVCLSFLAGWNLFKGVV